MEQIEVFFENVDPSIPVFKNKKGTDEDPGDAGFDLYYSGEDLVLEEGRVYRLDSNIKIEMPNLLYGHVTCRSGLSLSGLLVFPGTIDPSYRGVVSVICIPLNGSVKIEKGDRIAQMIFTEYKIPKMINKKIENNTYRGDKGFGHSGKK